MDKLLQAAQAEMYAEVHRLSANYQQALREAALVYQQGLKRAHETYEATLFAIVDASANDKL